MMTRILIVDDHRLVQEGLTWSFQPYSNEFEIAGLASSGHEAITLARALEPDVVFMDINLPGMDGLDAARVIKNSSPSTHIIFLTLHEDDETFVHAIRLGADAYVLKDVKPDHLVSVTRRVVRGEQPIWEDLLARWRHDTAQRFPGLHQESEEESAFLAAAIHNLKNELLIIGTANERLRDEVHDGEMREDCDLIARSVQYSQLLLRRTLDFLDIGRATLESVDSDELLDYAESLIRPRLPSNIILTVDKSDTPGSHTMYTNREQVLIVLMELVNNAIDAVGPRGGTIELKHHFQNSQSRISVTNNGPPIPSEIAVQLFREQVGKKKRGWGLGLLLARKVIDTLGGSLTLDSSTEEGTTFSIALEASESHEGKSK